MLVGGSGSVDRSGLVGGSGSVYPELARTRQPGDRSGPGRQRLTALDRQVPGPRRTGLTA